MISTRRIGWTAWALVPVLAAAWWFGPGQRLEARDAARVQLARASAAEREQAWKDAAGALGAAGGELTEEDEADRRRIAFAEARALVRAGAIVEGAGRLEALLEDLDAAEARSDGGGDGELARSVRNELATASYFTAWLMRLEGASAEEWKPETQKARQHFRLLAERANESDDGEADEFKKNVEAAIRLEKMDLSELQALPLPKNCPGNCDNISQKKREQRLSKCKSPGKKDAREELEKHSAGQTRKSGSGS